MLIKSNLHLYNHKLQKKKRMRHLIYASFVLLMICLFFYTLFFSDRFSIKDIKIFGAESISESLLKAEIAGALDMRSFVFLKNTNIFAMPSDFLRDELKVKFPKIKTVLVEKNIFKREVSFVITERKATGITCKNDDGNPRTQRAEQSPYDDNPRTQRAEQSPHDGPCFYFDSEGVIFNSSPVILGAQVLKIIDDAINTDMILPNHKYLESQIWLIGFLKNKALAQNNITLRYFSFLNNHGDISAETTQGFKIFFNSQIVPAEQIKVLGGILDKEIKDQTSNLDYIDLRVENRAYYKFK